MDYTHLQANDVKDFALDFVVISIAFLTEFSEHNSSYTYQISRYACQWIGAVFSSFANSYFHYRLQLFTANLSCY